mgnify:FL=1
MPIDIVIGAQWGDEGKGRIVDLLSAATAMVARFNGGDNAGHTVTIGKDTYKLHLIPSGIIHDHTQAFLGTGMVINPESLLKEMDMLRRAGVIVDSGRLHISHAAHLITPGLKALDAAQEAALKEGRIGTTGRGIGPAYTAKASRSGLRMEDMLDKQALQHKLNAHIAQVNERLTALGAPALDAGAIAADFDRYAAELTPYITDTAAMISDGLEARQRLLAEGAQGTLLDIDCGTYPFVTSSTCTAAGVFSGLGIGLQPVEQVIGIVKAFQTRVGGGPFPTELSGELAGRLRGTGENPWDEFGTTTGRPRRVGWLDGVLLRYAVRANGLNALALTKLDILSGLPTLRLCIAYRLDGQVYARPPFGISRLAECEPVYEDFAGWEMDVQNIRRFDALPGAARTYLQRIEEIGGAPIRWVSVGPEREQVIETGH